MTVSVSMTRPIEHAMLARAIGYSNFEIYGPILIGTFLGVFGCGAVVLGTFMYLDRYRQSSWFSKSLLIVVTLLNIAQSASDCSRVLKILVYYPNLRYFLDLRTRPEEIISPVLSILICTIVQLFLVDRCLLFTRINQVPLERTSPHAKLSIWLMGGLLCIGVALSFAGGLGTAIALHDLDSFLQAFRGFNPTGTFPTLATIWLSASAATDILISSVIIYQLWNAIHDKKKLIKSRMLSSMMTVMIHGGLVLTLLQVAILVTYFQSDSAWSDFPTIFISKVYSLTLLASWILPRQTHDIPAPRQKVLRRAHLSIPMTADLPAPIDPDQGRRNYTEPRSLFTDTELSVRKFPRTSSITEGCESVEIRSPRTFGEVSGLQLEGVTDEVTSMDYQRPERWRSDQAPLSDRSLKVVEETSQV
ncbi:hypothetical protein BD324DRAFT_623624 [Kockovaella imperatae]|uniref:DUF6534 domain-containing protein n=1 Tax=Kockovaella imperatae TaxID=4999 RepID=A0A1Y1UK17_9TREE|nr:hypothetical protein BD324DRAFT_623624 [Kockovaella imperatae]ORX37877.1 hypothetical protein BD324DRAFT_623624 [Kockovaella imperatae]